MCRRRTHAVHIRAIVVCPWCRKGRIGDTLRVQAKARCLRVVLTGRQRAGDHLRLEAVVPASLVFIGIIVPGGLPGLRVGIVEDTLEVLDRGRLLDGRGHGCNVSLSTSIDTH